MKKLLIIAGLSLGLIGMNSYATSKQIIGCPPFITCKNSVCTWGYGPWQSRTGPITTPKNDRYELKSATGTFQAPFKGACFYVYRLSQPWKYAWLDSTTGMSPDTSPWDGWPNYWKINYQQKTGSCSPSSWATPGQCPFEAM